MISMYARRRRTTLYSEELTNTAPMFTIGKGKDKFGQDRDLSASVMDGQFSVGLLGRTYTNLLGKKGSFETDTNSDGVADGWTKINSICSIVDGWSNKAQKIKCDGITTSHFYVNTIDLAISSFKPSTYYVVLGDVKLINTENINPVSKMKLSPNNAVSFQDAPTVVSKLADLTLLNVVQKIGTKYKTLSSISSNAQHVAIAYLNGTTSSNAEFHIDNIRIVEITQDEYNNLSIDQLTEKYPHIDDTKSTLSCRLKRVSRNLWNGEYVKDLYFDDAGQTFSAPGARSTKPIRCKPNTQYTISGGNRSGVRFFDNSGNIIGSAGSYTTVPRTALSPINAFTMQWYYVKDLDSQQIMINEGSAALPYEPYTEQSIYTPPDIILRSVGTAKDELKDGVHTQNTKNYVIQASDITGLYTTNTNLDVVGISKNNMSDWSEYNKTVSGRIVGTLSFENYTDTTIGTYDSASNIGKNLLTYSGSLILALGVPKGTYADLTAAKTALAGKTLTYQLASPIVTKIEGIGTLYGYKNGTVIVECIYHIDQLMGEEGIIHIPGNEPIIGIKDIKMYCNDTVTYEYVYYNLNKNNRTVEMDPDYWDKRVVIDIEYEGIIPTVTHKAVIGSGRGYGYRRLL